jgi:hypothetical protein
MATTLDGYVRHLGHSAVHIKDAACGRHAADVVWIEMLGSDSNDWVVMTGDDRIRKNHAERLAFRAARLRGFVLAPAYQKTPVHQVCSILIWRWPELEQILKLLSPPGLFELPIKRTSRLKQLPL